MTRSELYSFAYGMARGCYELAITIPLAVLYHNWIIAPMGLLGGVFMPVCYYAAGKLVKVGATRAAELSYGICRFVIYAPIAYIIT